MSILELLKKLDAEATPGPWQYLDAYRDTPEYLREADIGTRSEEIISRDSGVYGPSTEDAELIIHMRNALPKLLNVIEATLKAGQLIRDALSDILSSPVSDYMSDDLRRRYTFELKAWDVATGDEP